MSSEEEFLKISLCIKQLRQLYNSDFIQHFGNLIIRFLPTRKLINKYWHHEYLKSKTSIVFKRSHYNQLLKFYTYAEKVTFFGKQSSEEYQPITFECQTIQNLLSLSPRLQHVSFAFDLYHHDSEESRHRSSRRPSTSSSRWLSTSSSRWPSTSSSMFESFSDGEISSDTIMSNHQINCTISSQIILNCPKWFDILLLGRVPSCLSQFVKEFSIHISQPYDIYRLESYSQHHRPFLLSDDNSPSATELRKNILDYVDLTSQDAIVCIGDLIMEADCRGFLLYAEKFQDRLDYVKLARYLRKCVQFKVTTDCYEQILKPYFVKVKEDLGQNFLEPYAFECLSNQSYDKLLKLYEDFDFKISPEILLNYIFERIEKLKKVVKVNKRYELFSVINDENLLIVLRKYDQSVYDTFKAVMDDAIEKSRLDIYQYFLDLEHSDSPAFS